ISESTTEWLSSNSLLWATAEYAFNEKDNLTVSDSIDMGIDGKYCGTVLLLPEILKTPKIVKCYISEHKYISIFQVMPITKEQLS
ncbi:MAG: suppressor of fused domain protein, partial [Acholeplasmatales bacterium]|nr:suppressor of fused domain protein [Acholeplasmatales bacterium]